LFLGPDDDLGTLRIQIFLQAMVSSLLLLHMPVTAVMPHGPSAIVLVSDRIRTMRQTDDDATLDQGCVVQSPPFRSRAVSSRRSGTTALAS